MFPKFLIFSTSTLLCVFKIPCLLLPRNRFPVYFLLHVRVGFYRHLASDPPGTTSQSPPDVQLDDSDLLEISFFEVNSELCILFPSSVKRKKKTTFTKCCPVVETGSPRNLNL